MALPDLVLSTEVLPAAFSGGRSLPVSSTRDFETAGVALNNPTEGHLYQVWQAVIVDKKRIEISAEEVPSTLLYSGNEISEVSLTFDQNMRPAVSFVEEGLPKLLWFDTLVGSQVIEELDPDVITPRVSLDDKRRLQMQRNDIVLGYIKRVNKQYNLYFRMQRDRFEVEYLLKEGIGSNGIIKIGMNRINRFQFLLRYA